MRCYLKVLKNYAGFSGRARRKEYWMFVLFHIIFLIVAMLIDRILGTTFGEMGYGLIYTIYSLAVLIPALAVAVRRLHDTGKTGWWVLIGLVPIVGFIVLLIFMVMDSESGENKYGANPKAA